MDYSVQSLVSALEHSWRISAQWKSLVDVIIQYRCQSFQSNVSLMNSLNWSYCPHAATNRDNFYIFHHNWWNIVISISGDVRDFHWLVPEETLTRHADQLVVENSRKPFINVENERKLSEFSFFDSNFFTLETFDSSEQNCMRSTGDGK